MKRALQLFYFTLLTFCVIGYASAATYTIEWNAYAVSGWYVLDLDPQSTYPIAESYMHATYELNGGKVVFTHYFNGIESSWSFIGGGMEYSGGNPGWDPSSQMVTPAMSTWSETSGPSSTFAGDTPQAAPVPTTVTGTGLPDKAPAPTAIPIPSAIWLLGSAFIGLVGYRKKVRKTGSSPN